MHGDCRIEYATECKIEDLHHKHLHNIGGESKFALCAPAIQCSPCVCESLQSSLQGSARR